MLITEMEHHSNIVPWQLLCEATGARLRYLTVSDDGELSLDELDAVLGEGRVKLVAVGHISNVLGTINPVAEIVRRARAAGAVTLVDGSQAVPQMPVDLRAIDADFYAWTGHKALGPDDRAAARPPGAAGGDASLPRRRAHDLARRARALDLERAALQVRGRHLGRHRGRGPGRGRGLPGGARHGERARARARPHRLRAGAPPEVDGHHPVRPPRARPPRRRGGLRHRGHPPARHRRAVRPRGRLRARRPPLRPAADARARRGRHRPGVLPRLQRARRGRPAGGRPRAARARCSGCQV